MAAENVSTSIWAKVTTRFEGVHRWEDARDDVAFLRCPHRHIFHVTVFVHQEHSNRDVEYIGLKRRLDEWLKARPCEETQSCEMIACSIADQVSAWYQGRGVKVEVTEDGENGAFVERTCDS